MADPSLMSAAEIVAAIKDKKIKAADVAKAAFARAEQVKDLNALIFVNKDPAMAAAAEIDDGRPWPARARRPSHRHQGQHQYRRHADIRRHACAAEGAAPQQRTIGA